MYLAPHESHGKSGYRTREGFCRIHLPMPELFRMVKRVSLIAGSAMGTGTSGIQGGMPRDLGGQKSQLNRPPQIANNR